jgi:ribosomal protein L37AE/L43A
MPRMTKAEKAAIAARREAQYAEARRIVATGTCPQCGTKLRRNLSLTGWWQCAQLGAEGFRLDSSKPSCSFQTFTE